MRKQELFIKYHFNQTILLLIVSVLSVGFVVVAEDTNIFTINDKKGTVMGESTINNVQNQEENENTIYQGKVKNIIKEYIEKRAQFEKPHMDWIFLAKNVKYKLTNIDTPERYQDMHLKMVVILDKEIEVLSGVSGLTLDQINNEWKNLLNKYFWLND